MAEIYHANKRPPPKKNPSAERDFEKQLVPVPISATHPPPKESNGPSLCTVETQVTSGGLAFRN